jgi:hypothetical protein
MEIQLSPVIPLNTAKTNHNVVTKYLSVLTAEQISTFLTYERKKELGVNPLVISPNSIIKLDKDAQRGHADEYKKNLLQQKSKIDDIADTLLGKSEGNRAFLGTLVWNIRPSDGSIKLIQTIEDGVKENVIKIVSNVIYLPDSAHRHFGIAEAYRRYVQSPTSYQGFDRNAAFSVEVYNLDSDGEFELFRELNAKQKKISAAKQKAVDTVSPAGRLKGRILQVDAGEITTHYDEDKVIGDGPFFHDNYEETSNQLTNHKLLTMSVFMAAINEMFSRDELIAAKSDEELADELSIYFVRFFYTLREVIQIEVCIDGTAMALKPFYNLYNERLRDIVEGDANDAALQTAVTAAAAFAKQVRLVDKTNSNPVIKALARIGKSIRHMPRWDFVLSRIQTQGFEKCGGKLFQLGNPELITRGIATEKADQTLNIQVQNKEISAIYDYLFELAGLDDTHPCLQVMLGDERVRADGYVVALNRNKPTLLEVELAFWVGANVEVEQAELFVRVDNDRGWIGGKLTSPKKRPHCRDLEKLDVEHPIYGTDLRKHLARFEIQLPMYDLANPEKFSTSMKLNLPLLDGSMDTYEVGMQCQPSGKQ